jgi:hypothetical protein
MTQKKGFSWHHAVLIAFLITLAGFCARPVWDSDFYWHIATGRQFLAEGPFAAEDPFGVFGGGDPLRLETYLNAQWAGQVVLYGVYEKLGLNGVVALRVAILLACLLLLYARCRLNGSGAVSTWLVLLAAGLLLPGFTGERPQLFSFLFAGLLFLALDAAETPQRRRWLAAIPLIGLAWGNFHGGVVLGFVLLGVAWVGKLPQARQPDGRRVLALLALAGLSYGVASIVSPNGAGAYRYVLGLENTVLQERTSEYVSSLKIYTLGATWKQAWIVLLMLLVVASIPGLVRRATLHWLAVVLFLTAIAVIAIRYLPFLIFVGAPYVAVGLSRGATRFLAERASGHARWFEPLTCLALVVSLLVGWRYDAIFQLGISEARYPIQAVRSLRQAGVTGRAFNLMEWGGYLLWHSYPRLRPYIDGRMLDSNLLVPYTHILWTTPKGVVWFEKEQFDLVIIPIHEPFSGEPFALPRYLARRPEWRMFYNDQRVVVFVRAAPR